MKFKNIVLILIFLLLPLFFISGCVGRFKKETEKTMGLAEVVNSPRYDLQITTAGSVLKLNELDCPCFELKLENKQLKVWYDGMTKDDGTSWPAVDITGLRNGDWTIVTGRLQPNNNFWASDILNTDRSKKAIKETQETSAVYNALLKSELVSQPKKTIVIKETTGLDIFTLTDINEAIEYIKGKMDLLEPETLNSFKIKNNQPALLSKELKLEVDYKIISKEEEKEIFQPEESWIEFYKRYPNAQGIMTLSQVGFNSDTTQALLYVGTQSEAEAGAGFYYLLIKENDVWTIKDQLIAWIS